MKNYCRHCGVKLDPNQEHVCAKPGFFKRIKDFFLRAIRYDDSEDVEVDYYEKGKAIVPDLIEPDECEVAIKQYDLAVLRTRHKLTRAEGKMQITNKRLVFRAAGRSPVGKTVYQSEFAIDKIDGVEIRRDYRFLFWDFLVAILLSGWCFPIGLWMGFGLTSADNWFLGLLAVMLSIATAVPFFLLRKRYLLKLLAVSIGHGTMLAMLIHAIDKDKSGLVTFSALVLVFLVGLYCISMFMSFFKPNLVVEVKTSGGAPGMQIKHRFASFFVWKKVEENSGFSEILPGKDADLATKEIGAIINDLKTIGDLSVDKWKDANNN